MMDLDSSTPGLILNGPAFSVQRPTAVDFVDGKPVTAGVSSFDAQGSIQPLSGRELNILPEGDRIKEQVWVYTATALLLNDIVTYRGARYQTQTVERWTGYVRCRAVRIDVGEHAAP